MYSIIGFVNVIIVLTIIITIREYLLLNVLETVSNLLPLVYCSSPGYRTILAMKKQEKMGQEEDMTQTKQMTQDDEN